jgi:endonuclease YncB( thermonuclease family)
MAAPMPSIVRAYRASVLSTHDGDTFTGRLEIFPLLYHEGRVRLARCNAPELSATGGAEAAAFTAAWLGGTPWPINMALRFQLASTLTYPLIVVALGLDNYGRVLGEVYRTMDGRNLSDDLLSSSHAVPYALAQQLAP